METFNNQEIYTPHGVGSLSILQIGDVHLPDHRDSIIADAKDKAFPQQLIKQIAPTRLECVMKYLVKLLDKQDFSRPSAVLIGGDLTSKGDIKSYQDCVKYLCKSLNLDKPSNWGGTDNIHVVPGNHDIDRRKILPADDVFKKFNKLERTWENEANLPLTCKVERHTTAKKEQLQLDIFSINSCLGCGSLNYYPEKLRSQLASILKGMDFEIVGMQLDTPAFSHDSLVNIAASIRQLPQTTLPIVLSHHNILPQTEPRVEIYTEAINGGLVRSLLSKLDRPVIYCHGHLHKDPVEIVTSPREKKGRLISISAPLLSDGFNIIEIHFSKSRVPIGCLVRSYRLNDDGAVRESDPIRISLWGRRDKFSIPENTVSETIRAVVSSDSMRFQCLKEKINSTSNIAISDQDLMYSLIELDWAGAISIANLSEDCRHWHIHRSEL